MSYSRYVQEEPNLRPDLQRFQDLCRREINQHASDLWYKAIMTLPWFPIPRTLLRALTHVTDELDGIYCDYFDLFMQSPPVHFKVLDMFLLKKGSPLLNRWWNIGKMFQNFYEETAFCEIFNLHVPWDSFDLEMEESKVVALSRLYPTRKWFSKETYFPLLVPCSIPPSYSISILEEMNSSSEERRKLFERVFELKHETGRSICHIMVDCSFPSWAGRRSWTIHNTMVARSTCWYVDRCSKSRSSPYHTGPCKLLLCHGKDIWGVRCGVKIT